MSKKRTYYVSIKNRLLLLVMACIIATVALASWQSIRVDRQSMFKTTDLQLKANRESKARQLETYFKQIRNQVETMSANYMVVDAVKAFGQAFAQLENKANTKITQQSAYTSLRQYYQDDFLAPLHANQEETKSFDFYYPKDYRTAYLQKHYIALNQNPIGKKYKLHQADDASQYTNIHKKYHPVFRYFQEKFGFYDIFLVEQTTGIIVYSVSKEVDFATSLLNGPYADSNLGELFRQLQYTEGVDTGRLIDFSLYQASYAQPASFIGSPIFDGKTRVGTLIFQVSIEKVNEVTTGNKNWYLDGYGETGEDILIGQDGRLRSQSRFFIEQPQKFLHDIKTNEGSLKVIETIRKQNNTILAMDIDIDGLTLGLRKGLHDSFVDYRGKSTHSAFVSLDIPDVDWWLITKIDNDEITPDFSELFFMELLSNAFILVLLLPLAYWLIYKVLKPFSTINELLATESKVEQNGRPIEISLYQRAFQLNNNLEEIRELCIRLQEKYTPEKTHHLDTDITQLIYDISSRLSTDIELLNAHYSKAQRVCKKLNENWSQLNDQTQINIEESVGSAHETLQIKILKHLESQGNTVSKLFDAFAQMKSLALHIKSLRFQVEKKVGSELSVNDHRYISEELLRIEELCFKTNERVDICASSLSYDNEKVMDFLQIMQHCQIKDKDGNLLNPVAIKAIQHDLKELNRLFSRPPTERLSVELKG